MLTSQIQNLENLCNNLKISEDVFRPQKFFHAKKKFIKFCKNFKILSYDRFVKNISYNIVGRNWDIQPKIPFEVFEHLPLDWPPFRRPRLAYVTLDWTDSLPV